MIRTRSLFRLADHTVRYRRLRRRPVALVFRRPLRACPPAQPLAIRAGDQISVTLAPRFTVIFQQVARAVAVVDRIDRPAPVRSAAAALVADTGRLTIVHHRWSPRRPLPRPAPDLAMSTSGPPASGRRGMTPPLAVSGRPEASLPQLATGAAPPRNAHRPRARAQRTPVRGGAVGQGLLPPVPVRAEGVTVPARLGGSAVPYGQRSRRAVGEVTFGRSVAELGRSGDRAAMPSPRQPRFELELGRPGRSVPSREPRVAPVATVYRQVRPTEVAAPPAPPPTVSTHASPPVIDIDQLDRELWRRFEKRARTERERRGRA